VPRRLGRQRRAAVLASDATNTVTVTVDKREKERSGETARLSDVHIEALADRIIPRVHDDASMLNEFLRTTTTDPQLVDLSRPEEGGLIGYRDEQEPSLEPMSLGYRVGLFRNDADFPSLRLMGGIKRSSSTARLFARKPKEREKMFMLGKPGQIPFPEIYLQHVAPACFDVQSGRLRRASAG
jgi:hypothetical protein